MEKKSCIEKESETEVCSIFFFTLNLLYKELFGCTDYKTLEEVAKKNTFPSQEVLENKVTVTFGNRCLNRGG